MSEQKQISIMIFHDELCQVFNWRMEEMNPPSPEDILFMLHMEGAQLLACPLNKVVFEFKDDDFVEGVTLANPETFYTDIVMQADMNLTF